MIWSRITNVLRKNAILRLCIIAGALFVAVVALMSFSAVSSAQVKPAKPVATQTSTSKPVATETATSKPSKPVATETATSKPVWGKHHHHEEETPTPTPAPPPPAVPPTGSDPNAQPVP